MRASKAIILLIFLLGLIPPLVSEDTCTSHGHMGMPMSLMLCCTVEQQEGDFILNSFEGWSDISFLIEDFSWDLIIYQSTPPITLMHQIPVLPTPPPLDKIKMLC